MFPFDDEYSSKAETAITLESWHTNHTSYSGFILFDFIAFPIFSWLILLLGFIYINTCAPEPRSKKIKSILESNYKAETWACKLQLQNEFTMSLTFVLFSTSLASAAVTFEYKTESYVHEEVNKYFTHNIDVAIEFQRIFYLGIVLLILDAIILGSMLVCAAFCKKISEYGEIFKTPIRDSTYLAKGLKLAADSLAAAVESLPKNRLATEGTEGTEVSGLVDAKDKLQTDLLSWNGAGSESETVRKISQAKEQLNLVNDKFKGLSEVEQRLKSACNSCNEKEIDVIRLSKQDEVRAQKLDRLGAELKKLAAALERLMQSITHLPDLSAETLSSLTTVERDLGQRTPLATPPKDHDQVELEEWATSSGKFIPATQSLHYPTVTLKNDIEDICTDMEDYIFIYIDTTHPTNLQPEIIVDLTTRVQRQVRKVATIQAQADPLALTVSSIAAAAGALMKDIKHIVVNITAGMARNSLATAKMNFHAAELTIATASSAREAIDLLSLKINLNKISEKLTAVGNSCTVRDHNAPQGSDEFVNREKLKCAWNLTTAATNYTKLAAHLETSTENTAIHMLAKHLITVATNLTTAVSYIVLNDSASLSAELAEMARAASTFTDTVSGLNRNEAKSTLHIHWWQYCAYSAFFPFCCLFNHLNYIIIAFIHDLYHATGVAIVYGMIVIFLYVMLDNIPHILRCHSIKENLLALQVIKIIAVVLLLGYVATDILLYFFIPIRNAFDDAANHFLSIYNTTAVFFTALVLYFIIKHRHRSPMRVFTRALDSIFYKDEKGIHMNIKRADWKGLSEKDKDIEVAKSILKKME